MTLGRGCSRSLLVRSLVNARRAGSVEVKAESRNLHAPAVEFLGREPAGNVLTSPRSAVLHFSSEITRDPMSTASKGALFHRRHICAHRGVSFANSVGWQIRSEKYGF